jgi:hypothetical protein
VWPRLRRQNRQRQKVTIQVTIKKMEFHVTGYGREGNPTAIVVRNEDGVTHGFYSPLFKDTAGSPWRAMATRLRAKMAHPSASIQARP